jgi:hypothetical protein
MEFLRSSVIVVSLALLVGPVLLDGPVRVGPVLLDRPLEAQAGPASLGLRERANEHVSIASDGQFVAVAWAASTKAGTDIYVATSRDGARSFSDPVRANAIDGQANVNGEQPPQVVLASRPKGPRTITVIWTAKVGSGTRVLTSRSTDEGRTFSAAVPVRGTDAGGNRGWESIAVDPAGKTFALWLDHRDMASAARSGEAHQHGPQASQLFFAPLDGSVAQSLTRGVCYCCRTALVASEGSVYAAWRHVYADNHRDIAFTMSRDEGRTFSAPVRVSDDNWAIDGCPENGPALALDRQRRVHVVWPTRVDEKGSESLALFHSSTSDGKTFTQRARISLGGAAYHPRLVSLADGSLVVAWDEVAGAGRRIGLARGTPDRSGLVAFRPLEIGGPADGRYPAIATTPTHLVLAWTTRQSDTTRIAVARVPLS